MDGRIPSLYPTGDRDKRIEIYKKKNIQIKHQWMTVETIKIAGYAHGGKK
jgi:hypothetical protein